MRKLSENVITVVVAVLGLILCIIWYRAAHEIEPLIGIIASAGTLAPKIFFWFFHEEKSSFSIKQSTQKSSKGDNHKRVEFNNTKLGEPRKKLYKKAIISVVICICILLSIIIPIRGKKNFDLSSIKNNKTKAEIKILVLPFKQYSQSTEDIGKVLNSRLNNLARRDSLSMLSYFLEDLKIGPNFSHDSVMLILKESDFDFIIYGEQVPGDCNSNQNEVCINYVSNNRIKNSLNENTEQTLQKFDSYSIKGLFEGELHSNSRFKNHYRST